MSTNKRKHGVFSVQSTLVTMNETKEKSKNSLTINEAVETVFNQMKISGNRKRTIESYQYIFNQFVAVNKLIYVEDLNVDSIYYYLDSLDVSQQTKLIRLKSVKAVLSKFYNNGWLKDRFWANIQIRIDRKVKQGANVSDLELLLGLIDQTTFVGFRDVVAIKLMFKSGIRIKTLGDLREHHIDFKEKVLNLEGSILKNHKFLKLPIDDEMVQLLKTLIQLNKGIREFYDTSHSYVFITQNGQPMNNTQSSSNAIAKQLHKYSQRYNLKNINAHAIRRAYAKNLLDKGASIALISKALGHSDLAVTTQYLDIGVEEVAQSLREFI